MSFIERRKPSAAYQLLLRRQSRIPVHAVKNVSESPAEKGSLVNGREFVGRVQRAIDSAHASVERRIVRLRKEQEDLMNLIVDLMEAGKTVGDDLFRRDREITVELRGLA